MSVHRLWVAILMVGSLSLAAAGQSASPAMLPESLPAVPPISESASAPVVISPGPATTLLTTAPGTPVLAAHPAGTVVSPYPYHGCGGPYGGNGPITYELYAQTGPSLVVGGSELSGRLNTGWRLASGARTLFFNTAGDAAWVLDLGMSYTYNRGRQERGGPLDVHTPRSQPGLGGQQSTPLPELLAPHLVRGLHRTDFNFAIGRDWWMRGPGYVHETSNWNRRFGADIGGRWGTSHVDLVPAPPSDQTYLRRRSTTHSVFLGVRTDWERPMGAWMLFTGMRSELDYTFTNVVPPKGGDIVSISFLFHAGVRF